jgi:hypothetical protein
MNCSCWDKLSLDENEVNDDEDTEIEIMRPKRGLDQNDKTNQTIFFLIFLLPVFSSPMCELISLQEGIISHSLC